MARFIRKDPHWKSGKGTSDAAGDIGVEQAGLFVKGKEQQTDEAEGVDQHDCEDGGHQLDA